MSCESSMVRFFRILSERFSRENDLSDVVYTLCESNPVFRQFFLDFLFKGEDLDGENVVIHREISYDGSRPDFVIKGQGCTYFVEVKIWDATHHFKQYADTLQSHEKAGEKVGFAYITNYTINEALLSQDDLDVYKSMNAKGRVKTWKALRDELKRKNTELCDICGFIEYCEKVCPDIEAEAVAEFDLAQADFAYVKKMYDGLRKYLEKTPTIVVDEKSVNLSRYGRGDFNKPGEWIGQYFQASGLMSEVVWGWVGWFLGEKRGIPGLCIEFLNKPGWCKSLFERNAYSKDYAWRWCVNFGDNVSDVEAVVSKAFTDAFSSVVKDVKVAQQGLESVQNPGHIRDMRRLSLFIRQQIFPKISLEGGRKLIPVAKSDSHNPSGWCGEYFEVVGQSQVGVNNEAKETCCKTGWLGIYFDAQTHQGMSFKANDLICEYDGQPGIALNTSKEVLDSECAAKIARQIEEIICQVGACVKQ